MEPMEDASAVERMLMKKASINRIPINGSIELLPLCNMSCDMCYVKLTKAEMDQKGRLRTVDEWLEVAKQMKEAGTLFLLLTGGEPLLYPDFDKLYLALKQMGMVLTINTNGTLLDEKWAKFFGEHKPRRINITLYGSDSDAYDKLCHYPKGFDKAIEAIKLLREYDVDVKVACSVAKNNVDDYQKVISIGDLLGVPVRCDTYMMPATRERNKPYNMQSRLDPKTAAKARITALKMEMGEEMFKQYINQVMFETKNILPDESENHMTCYAGKCSFTVNWQGEMRPCVIMTNPAMSVFEHSFKEAWDYIVAETDKIILSSKCNQCNLRKLCRTCAASALLEEGDYKATPKYMCEYSECSLRYIEEEYNCNEENNNV